MNNAGDLIPSEPAGPVSPAPSWLRRHRLPLLAGGAALGVGVASVSAALVLMGAKPTASVEKMVPASADLMVVANLDPSLGQKANLVRVLHRFPQTSSDKSISDALDSALKGSGLSYSGDLRPWLGGELGFSARLTYDTTVDKTTAALYAVSRDDSRARASLLKLRSGANSKTLHWTDETYGGFQVSLGTPEKATDQATAYSLVDHVVVIANSAALIHEIIDTEQGRAGRLTDSAGYRSTMSSLPSDRLGLAYVNGASIVTGIKKQLAKVASGSSPIMGNVHDLDAFTGIGATLSAGDHGIYADMVVKLDRARLSASTRQALATRGRPDTVLNWIPRGTDAFVAVGSINRTIQSLIDSSKSDASIKGTTDALGLTGPAGVLNHLTGDAALEVHLGAGTPAGALLLRTDDPVSLRAFFNKLLGSASSLTANLLPAAPRSGKPVAPPRVITTTYHGVSISSLQVSQSAQAALDPSYAVFDGFGVIGSNLSEIKAVIDAHQGGGAITADPTYRTARDASLGQPTTIVYLSTANLLKAAGALAKGSAAANDRTLAAAEPVKALMLTGTSGPDQAYERLFLLID